MPRPICEGQADVAFVRALLERNANPIALLRLAPIMLPRPGRRRPL
jgi:hypothetical protein